MVVVHAADVHSDQKKVEGFVDIAPDSELLAKVTVRFTATRDHSFMSPSTLERDFEGWIDVVSGKFSADDKIYLPAYTLIRNIKKGETVIIYLLDDPKRGNRFYPIEIAPEISNLKVRP